METIELEFGTFKLYDNYIIGEINEEVHFDVRCNEVLKDIIADKYLQVEKVGYISNRINNYSIDPLVHHSNKNISKLHSIAVIRGAGITKPSYNLEAKFFHADRFKGFENMEDALEWTLSMIGDPVVVKAASRS